MYKKKYAKKKRFKTSHKAILIILIFIVSALAGVVLFIASVPWSH